MRAGGPEWHLPAGLLSLAYRAVTHPSTYAAVHAKVTGRAADAQGPSVVITCSRNRRPRGKSHRYDIRCRLNNIGLLHNPHRLDRVLSRSPVSPVLRLCCTSKLWRASFLSEYRTNPPQLSPSGWYGTQALTSRFSVGLHHSFGAQSLSALQPTTGSQTPSGKAHTIAPLRYNLWCKERPP